MRFISRIWLSERRRGTYLHDAPHFVLHSPGGGGGGGGAADVDVDINYSNIYVDTAQVGD